MKKPELKKRAPILIGVACLLGTAVVLASSSGKSAPSGPAMPSRQAMQTVTAEKPLSEQWQRGFAANGSIAAWQETIVGAELGGLRLAEVKVNVGDRVARGQVLARFFSDSVAAEVEQQQAALEEARAALAEAESNAEGARTLHSSGALSAQQSTQYFTAERSAKARVQSAAARLKIEQIRLRQASVVAPDDGVISARAATVGAVTGQGQELFRLIRNSRLEWRAEVGANELSRLQPGMKATLRATNGAALNGTVRAISPALDPLSRNGLVYVDLADASAVRAGMFASGEFAVGSAPAMSVPQAAVITRDGMSYVFAIGRDGKVAQTKVSTGRRSGERVELTGGATPDMLLVNQGAGFLADGDLVRVAGAMSSSKPGAPRATPPLASK
ncbi:MAG: efflux RND transporter periplasmic adaptor subunit [Pseudomonadota bacterium]